MRKTTKTIHYLRSRTEHDLFNLEIAIRAILNAAQTTQESQVEQLEQITQIMHRRLNPMDANGNNIGGLFLHIGHGVRDEHMRTMSNQAAAINDDGGTQAPPNGYSFLRKEAFLYIYQHHVIFCGHGFLAPSVATYLNLLSKKLHQENNNIPLFKIEFKAVGDCNKLAIIQEHGVKSIDLDASVYKLSVERIYQRSQSVLAKALSSFSCLLTEEMSEEEQEAQSEIQASVRLKLNGNSRASIEAQSLIQEQAEDLIDDENIRQGFSIVTQKGEVIHPSDVKLSKTVRIARYPEANSLQLDSAFMELSEYFQELQSNNLTEQ
jgi:hypothetical protein